jgi:hypothetical protein
MASRARSQSTNDPAGSASAYRPGSPRFAPDRQPGRHLRQRRQGTAEAADQGVHRRIPGVGDIVAPDRLGKLVARHRASPVQDQIDPEPASLPPRQVGFPHYRGAALDRRATTDVDP